MAEPSPEKGRWPFDPLQPGDHAPVRVPDSARQEKQNPPPKEEQEKKS